MDIADGMKVLGGFLGGGVVTKIVDYLLADRHERRSSLRARDHDRIQDIRSAATDVWAISREKFDKDSPHPPTLLEMERIDQTGQIVGELNDRQASDRWWAYFRGAVTLPLMRAVGEDEQSRLRGEIGAPKWEAMVARRYEQLVQRLNKLERRR